MKVRELVEQLEAFEDQDADIVAAPGLYTLGSDTDHVTITADTTHLYPLTGFIGSGYLDRRDMMKNVAVIAFDQMRELNSGLTGAELMQDEPDDDSEPPPS